ncbi:MAG TPA: hypothetical protein VIF09_12160, partial [Polyangiaceae bacterium]
MSPGELSRRSFLVAAASAGVGCAAGFGARGGAAGGAPGGAPVSDWVEGLLGAPLSKAIVRRCPGSPGAGRKIRGGFFTDVDPAGELLGAPSVALAQCAGSEHYWSGNEQFSVLRGVPALDPRSFGTANTGAGCVAGAFAGCDSNWELAGRAPSGVLHYRATRSRGFGLYVLPDRTWIVTQDPGPADLR